MIFIRPTLVIIHLNRKFSLASKCLQYYSDLFKDEASIAVVLVAKDPTPKVRKLLKAVIGVDTLKYDSLTENYYEDLFVYITKRSSSEDPYSTIVDYLYGYDRCLVIPPNCLVNFSNILCLRSIDDIKHNWGSFSLPVNYVQKRVFYLQDIEKKSLKDLILLKDLGTKFEDTIKEIFAIETSASRFLVMYFVLNEHTKRILESRYLGTLLTDSLNSCLISGTLLHEGMRAYFTEIMSVNAVLED